jgi:hypothetical protein
MEDETSDPRRWKKSGWIAHVIKNENDEGWARSCPSSTSGRTSPCAAVARARRSD